MEGGCARLQTSQKVHVHAAMPAVEVDSVSRLDVYGNSVGVATTYAVVAYAQALASGVRTAAAAMTAAAAVGAMAVEK